MIIQDNKHELLAKESYFPPPMVDRFAVVRGALAKLETTLLPLKETLDDEARTQEPLKTEDYPRVDRPTIIPGESNPTPSKTEEPSTAEEKARQLVNEALADVA